MGWQFRWRRSRKIGLFTFTQTLKGMSWSFGIPGLRYSVGQKGGRQIRLGIPGTGISWTKKL